MPEQNENANNAKPTLKDAVSSSAAPANSATPAAPVAPAAPSNKDILPEVVKRINDAQNILIALSSGPSVDELASAIGLSMVLDKMGKHATAIYSGQTPNALAFLKPGETFENNVDSLQDFVIALNKEKADHLRYKLDGDFVKIYITPYKTRIAVEDLDCSYGDFNVDLVIALNVMNGVDLDEALREYGRIMHDATVINITTNKPGQFGEIEWSDQTASSVSEIVAKLVYGMEDKVKLDKDEATAILTGIVAATERFSNAKTTAEAMQMVSKLMGSGADQQLVSQNITSGFENEVYGGGASAAVNSNETASNMPASVQEIATPASDPTNLAIAHGDDDVSVIPAEAELNVPEESIITLEEEPTNAESDEQQTTEETSDGENNNDSENGESDVSDMGVTEPTTETREQSEKIIQPPAGMSMEDDGKNSNKYGQMLEEALMEPVAPVVDAAPIAPQQDILDTSIPNIPTMGTPMEQPMSSVPVMQEAQIVENAVTNPAAMSAPAVPAAPEINGVPEINYALMPGEQVLPPPPTPPININQIPSTETVTVPTMPEAQPVIQQPQPVVMPQQPIMAAPVEMAMQDTTVLPQVQAMPVMQPQPQPQVEVAPQSVVQQSQPVVTPQQEINSATDPGAFKIPGM